MPAPSYIRPVKIDENSPFLGEGCALCKEPFAEGEEIVICPEDGSRHHSDCWRANGNHCTAYGCTGYGDVLPYQARRRRSREQSRVVTQGEAAAPRSKVRAMPSSSLGCAQTCLIISIAIAIILIAVGCYGLWAIADYILYEQLGWPYRGATSGFLSPNIVTSFFRDIQIAMVL